jgi:hypothetical protein
MKVLEALFMLISLSLIQRPRVKLQEGMELARERKFDETALNMVFGVNKAEESIYPRILISQDKIKFMDEKGITLSDVTISKDAKAVFSKEGHFVCIVEFPALTGQKQAFAVQDIKFSLFNKRGERLWVLKRAQEYDYPLPSSYISDKDGSVVLSDDPKGVLYFYDNKGELIKKDFI